MIRKTLQFAIQLLLLLTFVFTIHFYSCYHSFAETAQQRLLFAYTGNYVLAVLIYATLLMLEKKHSHLLGFSFMGGSLVKMAFFFIFFSGFYRADGKITLLEILAFLIPYGVCLVFETTVLIKKLNQ